MITGSRILLPSQPVAHTNDLTAQLACIQTGGSTNLTGGLATTVQGKELFPGTYTAGL